MIGDKYREKDVIEFESTQMKMYGLSRIDGLTMT